MVASLEVLADNQEALLLAEMAAWLHDMGKCTDEMIISMALDRPIDFIFYYKTAYSSLVGHKTINFSNPLNETVSIQELIETARPKLVVDPSVPWLIRVLSRCHGSSHIEKEEPLTEEETKELKNKIDNLKNEISQKTRGANKKRQTASELEQKGKGNPDQLKEQANNMDQEALRLQQEIDLLQNVIEQTYQRKDNTMKSSPFGFEKEQVDKLTEKLKKLPFDKITHRPFFLDAINNAFRYALGDTRRPINEITLSSWSSIVAALYKATLAGALLGVKPELNNLKWRLLAIRFNSELIYNSSNKITALLERKKWLADGLDNVKKLLEERYPLGNEVYRDENGSIFLVPDIEDLLTMKNGENQFLHELILENLRYEGEITINPDLGEPKLGQDPRRQPGLDEIFPIAAVLSTKPYSPPDEKKVQLWWIEAVIKNQSSNKANPEICNVSYLRPQGSGKGLQRKMSDFWADKVAGRAKEWFNDQCNSTIWIDEVADTYGRICLITGRFGVLDWLKPDGYLKSLFVKPPQTTNDPSTVAKNPSFARLRRIWETCKTFWEEVEHDFESTVEGVEQRLKIKALFQPGRVRELAPFYAYIVGDEHNNVQFSVISSDSEPDTYYITENLKWLAKKMGAELDAVQSPVDYIKGELSPKLIIYDSEGETREQQLGTLEIIKIEPVSTSYLPAISLLSEPGRFMALIPAAKALEVAHAVKEKYIKEMGKVRNRLPISLGLIFAPSHTPLVTLLDAGKRMLDMPLTERTLMINESKDDGDSHLLQFENGLKWRVPIKMGDSKITDIWYPYFYLNTETTGEPVDRSRAFKGSGNWRVHVTELKESDTVRIRPSYFDFEFLDSSARRFEISYKEDGKRRSTEKSTKPYYLEELDNFKSLWELLTRLSQSQIMNVNGLIETKRAEWRVNQAENEKEEKDKVFREFIRAVFHNARWEKEILTEEMEKLVDAACSGMLNDIIMLYHQILKEKSDKKMKEVAL